MRCAPGEAIDRGKALLLALLFWAPAAAASGEGPGPSKPVGGTMVKQGRIQLVRAFRSSLPQLVDAKGGRWILTGKAQPELRRLGGHVVKVWGRRGKKKLMQPTIVVARYAILDSGGRKPHVGVMRRAKRKERLRLQQKSRTLTIAAKRPLLKLMRRRVGCKVWVVGDLRGTVLRAHRFGWLRCRKAPLKPKKHPERVAARRTAGRAGVASE